MPSRLKRTAGYDRRLLSAGWQLCSTPAGGCDGPEALGRAWDLLRREIRALESKGDDARLQEILRHRKEEFTHERGLVPGKSWAAWARALGHLLPAVRVADLGCGEGYLALEAARWAKHVVAVDVSERALSGARALAEARSIRNLSFKRGEIEDLPLEDSSVDVALLSQALHHAKDPARAIREAARVLASGGTLLLLDLKSHKEEWVKKLGDKWMGFDEDSLRNMMKDAGLRDLQFEIGASRRGDPFQVIVASGRKGK